MNTASLVALAAIVAGIFLTVSSFVDPRVGVFTGVGGVALVLTGVAIFVLLRRYDLDE